MRRYQVWTNRSDRADRAVVPWRPDDRMEITSFGEFPAPPLPGEDERNFVYVWTGMDQACKDPMKHGDVVSLFDDSERVGSWVANMTTPNQSGWEKLEAFPVVPGYGYAVWQSEMIGHGCPTCGHRSGRMHISGGGSGSWSCSDGHNCIVLADGLLKSTMGLGFEGRETVYPERTQHPRLGIPSHGDPDKRPETGGEFFRSRGVGMDLTPGCWMCETPYRNAQAESIGNPYMNNIAAFVQCRAAGERVVAMFVRPDGRAGARLDYRDFEPDRVQVKIGACEAHTPHLQRLHDMTRSDGIITVERIAAAKSEIPAEVA